MTNIAIKKTPADTQGKLPRTFQTDLPGLTYADIADVREQVLVFLENHGLGKTYKGKLALTLTEILTNLVKHPKLKAKIVRISLHAEPGNVTLDVSDDSSPFSDFDAKCRAALQKAPAAICECESGYGLSCILKQHANVWYAPGDPDAGRLNSFIVKEFLCMDKDFSGRHLVPKKIVFLIDDDPISLKIHKRMLEGKYEVQAFQDARAALDAFAQSRPDLVVSDLHMPDMDGIALRKELSSREGGTSIPFVFLSGQRSGENNPYINQLGIDDFLCKPVTQEKILAVLHRLMGRSEQLRNSMQGEFHHTLSHALKPALPALTQGWKITTLNSVAESGGGDFTLCHETPLQTLAVLADVMGHGPMAKFFSYAYAGYLRSLFRMFSDEPDAGRFLKKLSSSISGDEFLESIIMTCQAFQFFPEGRFRVASAGHPPPVLIRGGICTVMEIAGPLPGLLGETSYAVQDETLIPGDKVLFTTDGFLQVFDKRDIHQGHLLSLLRERAALPHDRLAKDLWSAFADHDKNSPLGRDDATLIIAEYGGA